MMRAPALLALIVVCAVVAAQQPEGVSSRAVAKASAGGSSELEQLKSSVILTRGGLLGQYSDNPNLTALVDERDGSAPADDHPIAWWRSSDGGRSFFTGLGFRAVTYTEPLYLSHLLGGVEYAAGVGRMPPQDAIVLFDGASASAFENAQAGNAPGWQIDDDSSFITAPGSGDVKTKQAFTDYQLHLEFKTPAVSASLSEPRHDHGRVSLHGCYELQLRDSYGATNFDESHLGAIYNAKAADSNAALPAETWQVNDTDFTAPRFDAKGRKTANARITVYLNGVLIHDDVEIKAPTIGRGVEQPGPQPLWLNCQKSGNSLRFRNIWLLPAVDTLTP